MTPPDDWRGWDDASKSRLLWRLQARPEQLTPPGDWNVWLLLAGRGFGKTKTLSEDAAEFLATHPGSRVHIVAPTIGDARDTNIEGESGLLNCLPSSLIDRWNRSMGQLTLKNGARVFTFSSEEPERLRGPQCHRAYCDEIAAWDKLEDTWDMLMFGLRLPLPDGKPQCVVATTPKPIKALKRMLNRTDVHVTRGSTFDNAKNLSPAAIAQLKQRYEGTRLGRQELHAELLDDIEGALWTHDVIQHIPQPEGMKRVDFLKYMVDQLNLVTVVVAVDPAVTAHKTSDETGIIVAGRGRDGLGYVLEDLSGIYSPDQWGRKVLQAYDAFDADRIVPEVNQGGDLVVANLKNLNPYARIKKVHATRGKIVRAEPVAALYEQKKIFHVGVLGELEDQLTSYDPVNSTDSPDRLDALVWALTDLFVATKEIKHTPGSGGGRLRGRR